MTNWTTYLVTFKLLSPIHVGWRKTGNLQQTRPYVTGRTFWGALTACLVRESHGNNYKTMGDRVDKQLAYTYFYPSTDQKQCDFYWDDWEEFSWKYLGSYVSTALQKGRSAEEGSLHETEFIAPVTRDNKPVYLLGYIFEKESCDLKWREVLNQLQLGGERGYGWGRVSISPDEDVKKVTNNKIFDCDYVSDSNYPSIKIPTDKRIYAHASVNNLDCEGIIEPLVGRETDNKANFGKCCSKAEICWSPGSKVKKEVSALITERGVWRSILQ